MSTRVCHRINLAQMLTIDKRRLLKKIGSIKAERIHEVDEALKISLGPGI